jgi:Lipocalin-like domain
MRIPLFLRSLTIIGIYLFSLTAESDARPVEPSSESLIGAWKLVSIEYSGATGPQPDPIFWPHSSGVIIYDRSGCMSVQIVAPNRPDIADKPRTTSLPLDDESARAAAFETYYAYYGTWSFDPGSSTVTHHIHSSLLPYEVGRNYRRLVTFDGQRLRLTVDPSQDRGRGKQLARRVLTWERITAPR